MMDHKPGRRPLFVRNATNISESNIARQVSCCAIFPNKYEGRIGPSAPFIVLPGCSVAEWIAVSG